MKKVLMLKTRDLPEGTRNEGSAYKVTDEQADALVADGSAELLPEPKEHKGDSLSTPKAKKK